MTRKPKNSTTRRYYDKEKKRLASERIVVVTENGHMESSRSFDKTGELKYESYAITQDGKRDGVVIDTYFNSIVSKSITAVRPLQNHIVHGVEKIYDTESEKLIGEIIFINGKEITVKDALFMLLTNKSDVSDLSGEALARKVKSALKNKMLKY